MKSAFGGILLLSTFLHVSRGDRGFNQESPIYAEKYDLCFPIAGTETGALNIGQHWGTAKPTATTQVNLLIVTSPISSFDFRTFDPEGVVFYGSTNDGQSWFLLGLWKGLPWIQMKNSISQISISGGIRVNDGEWHRVSVKSEGENIVLEVDHVETLRIWHSSLPINTSLDITNSSLSIAVGGVLLNQSNLLVPMNPAMDGCIRSWEWMNQTREWLTGPSLDGGPGKRCFELVQKGSFFAGVGMAVFSPRDFGPRDDPAPAAWALRVEMRIRPSKRTGFLLAVSALDGSPALTLRMKGEIFILEVGGTTTLRLLFPNKLCLGSRLVLHITKAHLSWEMDEKKMEQPIPAKDYQALRDAWQDERGHLFVGGIPDKEINSPLITALAESQIISQEELPRWLIIKCVKKRDSLLQRSCDGGRELSTASGLFHSWRTRNSSLLKFDAFAIRFE